MILELEKEVGDMSGVTPSLCPSSFPLFPIALQWGYTFPLSVEGFILSSIRNWRTIRLSCNSSAEASIFTEMPKVDISPPLCWKDVFQTTLLLYGSHSKPWREGHPISLWSQPRCCINHASSFQGSLFSVCWLASSQGVHKLLQKKLPDSSASSGRSDEMTWNRDGHAVWFWNPANCTVICHRIWGSEVFWLLLTMTGRERRHRPKGGSSDGWAAGQGPCHPPNRASSKYLGVRISSFWILLSRGVLTHSIVFPGLFGLPSGVTAGIVCAGGLRLVTVLGLLTAGKWSRTLWSAIENSGSIHLAHLNLNLLCSKYLDTSFLLLFLHLFVCLLLWEVISESDNQHCLLMMWLGLQMIQVNAYMPFTCTNTTYFLVTYVLSMLS